MNLWDGLEREFFLRFIQALIVGKRLLLRVFSQPMLGPVFFEFIQHKDDEGFGEGYFKALFESLERDQVRRGALTAAPREG